jgi:hypothetical protein
MAEAPENTCTTRRRWYRLTPDRVVWALLPLEGLLILSEWFRWFPFNEHKGWTVLVAIAGLGAVLLLMFLWFLAALAFRLRFQFSILSLLVLAVVVAVPFSWLKTEMNAAKRQREAVEWIKKAGGDVGYDDAERHSVMWTFPIPSAPPWLWNLLGDDFFADVAQVNLSGRAVSDAGLEHLEGLTHVEVLWLHLTNVNDAGLQHLKALTRLQELWLDVTRVSDPGMEQLKGLIQLRVLSLAGTNVSDAGLEPLKRLTKLRALVLAHTKVSDRGVKDFQKALPKVVIILR